MKNYFYSSNQKEITYNLIDNKINKLIIDKEIFKDITNEEINKILGALKINKSLKSLILQPHCIHFFDDFTVINEKYLIKPYISIIKKLNTKNNFKLLYIDYIYNINTLYKILKNNFKYDLKLSLKCCNMRHLFLLTEYLKHHKNKIHLKINVFENNYYQNSKNNKVFQEYKYYYSIMHYIHFLSGYELTCEYTRKELDDIYRNNKKYEDLFNNIVLKSMYTIINDLKKLVNFLKNYNNIILKIRFNYMFRKLDNIQIFSKMFYEKYGEELKNNILFV